MIASLFIVEGVGEKGVPSDLIDVYFFILQVVFLISQVVFFSGAPAARRAAKRSPIPIETRQLIFSW